MQIDQTKNIEKQIGAEIARVRKVRKLTQKEFAERLAGGGMNIDATAVSRLEKGERSLRIAECVVIAEVLNMGVESLLRRVRTPAQSLKEVIRDADLELATVQRNLWRWLAFHYDAKLTLETLPELLETISPDLGSAEEYLPRVAERLSHYSFRRAVKPSEHHLGVRNEADKKQLMDCVVAYFDHLILVSRNWPKEESEDMWDWRKDVDL